jgi:hypothetical protein
MPVQNKTSGTVIAADALFILIDTTAAISYTPLN